MIDWTKNEILLLQKLYPIIMPKEIQKFLPDRTINAIRLKAEILRFYPSLQDRFERYFIPITECGCWLWIGGTYKNGYGVFQNKSAHRTAWKIYKGPIPNGMCVLHKCDVNPCVNPNHLFLGTIQDNINDKCKKKHHQYGEKHHMAKLTEQEVKAIRQDNRTHEKISNDFPVSRRMISRIKSNENWTHI